MNRRMVLYVTGRVTFVVGVLMILPILVALIYHEGTDTIYPLFQAMVATMAVGAAMASRPPKRRSIYVREGLAITGLSWIMLVIFGSLPYLFTGAIPSIPDAIFETASGFTTTGLLHPLRDRIAAALRPLLAQFHRLHRRHGRTRFCRRPAAKIQQRRHLHLKERNARANFRQSALPRAHRRPRLLRHLRRAHPHPHLHPHRCRA